MQEVSLEAMLDKIMAADGRYERDAYLFVKDALDFTQKIVAKSDEGKLRHVSGQELLAGIRDYALEQFGPMTITVFAEWGIHGCDDFGEIVFNMVESSLLAKTDKDTREDFKTGYDFNDTFRKPYLPASKLKLKTEPRPLAS